ncbi:MAG: hypothetical protein L0H31_08470 [Nocardioidaceae bacterium]|nr:hypothetical protein [Nocardioidaceae bacterium]
MRPTEWARVLGVPVVAGALFGLVGGWLWWRWWGPPLTGKIYETIDGKRQWFPDPIDPGLPHQFGATAIYVVLGLGLAVVLGLLSGWICRHRAVWGVAAVLVASILAAIVMVLFGQSQSPPDPQEKADSVKVGTELDEHMGLTPGEIDLTKKVAQVLRDDDQVIYVPTAQLIWPAGALAGYLILMVLMPSRPASPGSSIAGGVQPVEPSVVRDGEDPAELEESDHQA